MPFLTKKQRAFLAKVGEDFQEKKYYVTVDAKSDLDAKNIYEKLTEMGFDCRINK